MTLLLTGKNPLKNYLQTFSALLPHERFVNWEHGVIPRSSVQDVGSQERPGSSAECRRRGSAEDGDTAPLRRDHIVRCCSAQTQEGEWLL